MSRSNVTDALMAEVVNFGGIPLTRADAYRAMREDGHDTKRCDYFVFGCLRSIEAEPLSLDQYRAITA